MDKALTKAIATQLRRNNIDVPESAAGIKQFLSDWVIKGEHNGRPVNKNLPLDKIDYDLLSTLIADPATGRPNKLEIGVRVRIVGNVMLKGLRDGECYQIVALHPSAEAYILRRLTKSGKISKRSGTQGYYYRQIDGCLNDNLNRIELL